MAASPDREQERMTIDRRSFLSGLLSAGLGAGPGWAAEMLEDLSSRLAIEDKIPGLAVATLEAGSLSRSFCLIGGTPQPRASAIFQAASLSKPVVSYLALRMVQAGDLQLDRTVDEVLPGGYLHRQNIFALKATPVVDRVPVDVLRRITPRMLLMHTAGLPNWSPSGPLVLQHEPGSRWQYSGESFVLLQHLMETVSGLALQQLAEQRLFQPLGLAGTAFRITDAIKPHLISGTPRQLRFPYEIAASSLYTTAEDYAKFLAHVLEDEELVSLITEKPVTLPSPWWDLFGSGHLAWGLGWGLEVGETPVSLWHWGSNPGFRSLVMADPVSRHAVVVFTSSEEGMAVAKQLVRAEMPAEHPGLDFAMVN